jgi:hypothetical protein
LTLSQLRNKLSARWLRQLEICTPLGELTRRCSAA